MTNHVDRFHAAVTVLAGNGRVKQRLIRAYEENLLDIDTDDLPPAIRQDFADLKTSMYRVAPSNGEGPICASVRKMSSKEAGAWGMSIVALYRELMRLGEDSQAVVAANQPEGDPVPPFLVKTS